MVLFLQYVPLNERELNAPMPWGRELATEKYQEDVQRLRHVQPWVFNEPRTGKTPTSCHESALICPVPYIKGRKNIHCGKQRSICN